MPAWLLPALAAGGNILSGLFSGQAASKSAKAMQEQAEAMNRIAGLQEESFRTAERTAEPFRNILFPQMEDILSGEKDITSLPYYAARRYPLEEQFARAEESIRSGPRGGALASTLAELETARAREVGGLPGQLYQEFLTPGLNLAGLNITQAPLSLGNAASSRGSLLNTFAGLNQESLGNLSAAGAGIGSSLYDIFSGGGGDGGGDGTASSYGLDVDLGIFG